MARKRGRITAAEWLKKVKNGAMADYEGFAYLVSFGKVDKRFMMVPSARGKDIPWAAEMVEWYSGI